MTEAARSVHDQSVIIDGLSTSNLTPEHFQRMRTGGLSAVNWTAAHYEHETYPALQDIARARNLIADNPDHLVFGDSVRAIEEARATGRTAIIMGLQNGKPIGDDILMVRVLKDLGVRIVQLTYNERNFIGDGCTEPQNSGLSQFGIKAVQEMDRLGLLIDLSHCGLATTAHAIEVSEQPVAITHSNPSRFCPSPRNKPDQIIRDLFKKGGVFGVCIWSPITYRDPQKRPTLVDVVDTIRYLCDLAGDDDHVGLGTDHGEGVYERDEWERHWGRNGLYPTVTGTLGSWYGFDTRYAEELESVAYLPRLTGALLDAGMSDSSVTKIMGGNFLRLFKDVWGE